MIACKIFNSYCHYTHTINQVDCIIQLCYFLLQTFLALHITIPISIFIAWTISFDKLHKHKILNIGKEIFVLIGYNIESLLGINNIFYKVMPQGCWGVPKVKGIGWSKSMHMFCTLNLVHNIWLHHTQCYLICEFDRR